MKADAKGKLTEFKDGVAELETEAKGGKASLVLACGLTGGESFKIEAGTEKGKADASATVVNWRKLAYEIIQPVATGPDAVSDYTVFTSDKAPGLSKKSKSYMKEILGKCFVEFEKIHADTFNKVDLPQHGKPDIFDGAYLYSVRLGWRR